MNESRRNRKRKERRREGGRERKKEGGGWWACAATPALGEVGGTHLAIMCSLSGGFSNTAGAIESAIAACRASSSLPSSSPSGSGLSNTAGAIVRADAARSAPSSSSSSPSSAERTEKKVCEEKRKRAREREGLNYADYSNRGVELKLRGRKGGEKGGREEGRKEEKKEGRKGGHMMWSL